MLDIEWKDQKKGQRFDWISEGETFEYDGKFFIKVKPSNVDTETGAICLYNGHRHHFDDSTFVIPVKISGYAEEV